MTKTAGRYRIRYYLLCCGYGI